MVAAAQAQANDAGVVVAGFAQMPTAQESVLGELMRAVPTHRRSDASPPPRHVGHARGLGRLATSLRR